MTHKTRIILGVCLVLAIASIVLVYQKREKPPEAITPAEKKVVAIDGHEVWYREEGTGIPIIILVGWGGPTDPYFPIQDELANKGYRVFLPDLPGLPGKTPSRFIPADEWSSWVAEFAQAAIGEPFFIVAHSLSAQISLRYVSEQEFQALGLILLSPWLVSSSQEALWRFNSKIVHVLAPIVYQEMSWVRDEIAWSTALDLVSAFDGHPKVPCLILWGKRDLARLLFTGWEKIDCDTEQYDWDHSPQIRATEDLAAVIDEFIRRKIGH